MSERSSHPPGAFAWAELATSDAPAAKAFYSSLFGWEYEDSPVGEGMTYSIARRSGLDVAALFDSSDQPPHWNCYVSVPSVDDTTDRARAAGATVMSEPFDVMQSGRMSVLADPQGAVLCLWEAREHIGARLVNTPGAMTWNDLLTPDPEQAAGFYERLFGWRTQEVEGGGGYRVIFNGERSNGGMMPLDPATMGDTPPNWMPYFGHEDVERVAREVAGLGGRLYNGPTRMPQGTIAVLADPQGAAFAVWTGAYDD